MNVEMQNIINTMEIKNTKIYKINNNHLSYIKSRVRKNELLPSVQIIKINNCNNIIIII